MRVRDAMDEDRPIRRRVRSKLNPMMIEEIIHRIGDGPSDPINILIATSSFREDAPWVYELALDVYRSVKSGDRVMAGDSLRKFIEIIETLRKGPFAEELGIDKRYIQMLFHEILPRIEKFIYRDINNNRDTLSRRPTIISTEQNS